ncbi:unnamed protein product [Musa hybrid cultivar]
MIKESTDTITVHQVKLCIVHPHTGVLSIKDGRFRLANTVNKEQVAIFFLYITQGF